MDGRDYDSITYNASKRGRLFEFPEDLRGSDSVWLDGTRALLPALTCLHVYGFLWTHGLVRVA